NEELAALNVNTRPLRVWRTPLYRSQLIAVAAGMRAALCLLLPSALFVLAGWPASSASLSLVVIVIGLGATKPDPKAFTAMAFIASPIAAALAGTLEFLILDGVNEFVLLALALAPFMIGATVLTTRPNPLLSSLGSLNLIFILAIFAPSNPPAYNPQAYLFTALFLCVATGLLLMAQIIVPAESNERRQRWLMASAHRDFKHLLSGRDQLLAPEEAMYRDSTRIGQITGADNAILAEALSYFDCAAAIRLCRVSLVRLAGTSLSQLAAETEKALAAQDTQRLREIALMLNDVASAESVLAKEISGELAVAAVVIDATKHSTAHLEEIV
ncbi:MAG: FUSC family protein, partial [Gammaproteobacteria bacterium]|nr:FUSC family protein [Gammaproteobacteria bacterium]